MTEAESLESTRNGIIGVNQRSLPAVPTVSEARARGKGKRRGIGEGESELVARGELAKSCSKREVGGRKADDDWMEPEELEEAQDRGAGNLTVGITGVASLPSEASQIVRRTRDAVRPDLQCIGLIECELRRPLKTAAVMRRAGSLETA